MLLDGTLCFDPAAMVVLGRNAAVLDPYIRGKVRDKGKRHLKYFISAEGHARFQERVRDSLVGRFGPHRIPKLQVDAPVPALPGAHFQPSPASCSGIREMPTRTRNQRDSSSN